MNSAPKWFTPVAVVALVWNILGCTAYIFDVMLTEEDVAKMAEAQQAIYAARPAWSVASTAVAVWLGALGCLGLILRKKWSWPLLTLSALGVVVQDIWLFALSDAGAVAGPVAYVMQGIVLIIAITLVVLSRHAVTKEWLA